MLVSPTLCTHLWSHAVVDIAKKKVRACCKTPSHQLTKAEIQNEKEKIFLNLPYMIENRQQMLNGGKPSSCSTCWKLEENGIKSFRTESEDWKSYVSGLGKSFDDPSLKYSFNPNNLDIQLDNYCDLKCIYCNEEFSSQWENENNKHGLMPYEFRPNLNKSEELSEFNALFFSWFEKVKMGLERIAFLGGEPLISPIFYDYLERIISSYGENFPKKLDINIITNLNTPPKNFEKFVSFLLRFNQLVTFNINISMEASSAKAELIRHGVDYERFKENFRLLTKIPNVVISTITTVNLFSISSLKEYLEFLSECEMSSGKKIIHYSNIISWPQYLNVDLVHESFASTYLEDCIQLIQSRTSPDRNDLREYLSFLLSLRNKFSFSKFKNTEKHQYALNCISLLEKRRNINFRQTFPEYNYLWE